MKDQAITGADGWLTITLGELGTWSGGGTPSKAVPEYWTCGDVAWVSPKDMKSDYILDAEDKITRTAVANSAAKIIPANSVLMVTRSGILAHTFPVSINKSEVAVNQDLKTLTPSELTVAEFIAWYLRSKNHEILHQCSKDGTTVTSIDTDRLKSFEAPLPPFAEQHRIVDKIDTLFARLDKGEEAVRAVQALLRRYRQSVLKAAVTGELTRDWRAANVGRREHGRDLLARILKTRRETWTGRGRYQEPAAPDTSDLPALPEGWVWASLDSLISNGPQNGLYLPQTKYGAGTSIVRIDDYQVDRIRPRAHLRLAIADEGELETYGLRPGDILVNRVNSISHLGKATLIKEDHAGCTFESNMMRFSMSEAVQNEYVSQYLTSEFGRKLLIKNCKHAVNQASINQADVGGTPIPLPSSEEQELVVEAVTEAVNGGGKTGHMAAENSTMLGTGH